MYSARLCFGGQASAPADGSVPSTAGAANVVDLAIRKHPIRIADGTGTVVSVNGTVPAPLLRFREGLEVTINVRNEMPDESTSIHWHGLLVPWDMDGVPGVSFARIPARQTFTYSFKLRQSGTYWYHSHSGAQEQIGLYGPLIIDPLEPEPYNYDRDYVVLLSDWTFEDPVRVMDRLKNQSTYYNFQQRTAVDFFRDVKDHGWRNLSGPVDVGAHANERDRHPRRDRLPLHVPRERTVSGIELDRIVPATRASSLTRHQCWRHDDL